MAAGGFVAVAAPPRQPEEGLLHWCGLLPAGLPLLAEGLGLVSYHYVFIYFICTVTESHEKWHEMLYILWGKKYRPDSWLKNGAI